MLSGSQRDVDRLARELMAAPSKPLFADLRRTEQHNAELFAVWAASTLRYSPEVGWLSWDGRRWAKDADGAAYRLAAEFVRELYAAAGRAADESERKAVAGWAIKCEKRAAMDALLALAKYQLPLIVRAASLDSDPYVLNLENGTLDLRTATLRPHDPGDLITRLAPVGYDPDAQAPTFERFLRRVLGDDAELCEYVQRLVGYSVTGATCEHVLPILYGVGANGKSTLVSIIGEALGDYATTTPSETLLDRRDGHGIPNDIARLDGVRFVAAAETEDGRRLAESRIKSLTGGDEISARFLHREFFVFRPKFKIWLSTNHRPEVRGNDVGIWRRLKLIPFSVVIPEDGRDPHFIDKLRAELPGVLAWAMRGCLEWQRRGLRDAPEAVTLATSEYRLDSDALGRWMSERCVLGPQCEAKAGALYSDFKGWAVDAGEQAMSATAFGRRLVESGLTKRKRAAGIYYEGVGLRADA